MTTLYSGHFRRNDRGEWFIRTLPRWLSLRALRVWDPSPGARVTALYLGEGRENELVAPVDPRVFDAMLVNPEAFVWSDPRIVPNSTLTMVLDGTAEVIVATFIPIDPPRSPLRSVPPHA